MIYLSHGLGVNSWALYLLLIEQGKVPGVDFEAVAVNHGTDWPETYEYLEMMQAKGYPVTVLKPCSTLYEYCVKIRQIPSPFNQRWCTDRFKIRILKKYYKTPAIEMIAFDVGEKKRTLKYQLKKGATPQFLLVEKGLTRQDCINTIKRHGLPVPIKSGCYICRGQRREQWILLKQRHPDLFQKAVELERLCCERRIEKGKSPVYFYAKRPLEVVVKPKDSRGRLATIGTQEIDFVERR